MLNGKDARQIQFKRAAFSFFLKTFRVECGIFHFAIQEGLTESAYENWMRCDVATPDFFRNMLQRCALLKDIE